MAERKFLGREEILRAPDIQTEELYVPEWEAWVRVRGMTARERDDFEASMIRGHGRKQRVELANTRARFVALVVVDEQGQRLFSEADTIALGAKSAAALNRICDVGQRLSGLTTEDLEELTEGLKNAPSDGSGSD